MISPVTQIQLQKMNDIIFMFINHILSGSGQLKLILLEGDMKMEILIYSLPL